MPAMGHENFIDGCHGGHLVNPNGTVLAIKNRHVDPMPPIKFQLILNIETKQIEQF